MLRFFAVAAILCQIVAPLSIPTATSAGQASAGAGATNFTGGKIGVLVDPSDPCAPEISTLVGQLGILGVTTSAVTIAELANPKFFNASAFTALILPSAPSLPQQVVANYIRFAEAGGDLVLLGGKPPRVNVTKPGEVRRRKSGIGIGFGICCVFCIGIDGCVHIGIGFGGLVAVHACMDG